MCLNWGCIPTKALIHNAEVLETLHDAESLGFTFENLKVDYAAAVKRSRDISGRQAKGVGFLMRKNKIEVIEGHGVFTDPHTLQISPTEYFPESKERTVTAANVIIAVGARARGLPGVEIDGDRIIQYRDAIVMDKLPKKLIVVGSGAIGMEFSYIYNAWRRGDGNRDARPGVAVGGCRGRGGSRQGRAQGGHQRAGKYAHRGRGEDQKGVKVTVKNLKDDSTETLEADKVLMAAGVQPNTDKAGLDAAGVQLSERGGYVEIDEVMRTNVPHIYAIGDCTGKLALAHVASAQALVAAETIAGVETIPFPPERYQFMPRCTFCSPQVASMGMTEAQAKEAGHEIKVGKFPFMPNGKAQALRLRRLREDHRRRQVWRVAPSGADVTELLPELSLAQFMEITPAEIARNVHSHPTLSEAIMEAAHAIEGHPIHI